MAKSNANVFIPTLYQLWTAPLGAAVPATPTAAPSAAWYEVGYLSDQGITEGRSINETQIYDAVGVLVATARSQEQRPFTFQALEDNRVVRELRYPGSSLSSGSGTSEVQTVTVTATGGTCTLTGGVGGVGTTGAISAPGTSSAVQTAVRTLPGLSAATVSGSAGGPYTITMPSALGPVALLTLDATALTGGSATIAETTPGVAPVNTRHVKPYNGQNFRQWLIRMDKGSKHNLFVILNGEATQTGTINRVGSAAAIAEFQLLPYQDSNGDLYQVIDDDPSNAATISWA